MKISPPLSVERIHQICNETNVDEFYKELQMKYHNQIEEDDYSWLKSEIIKLRKNNREKGNIIQKKELVKYLYNELQMSFLKIAQLLKRHHTSISHLYYS